MIAVLSTVGAAAIIGVDHPMRQGGAVFAGEPEPQKMSPFAEIFKIFKGATAVQYRVIAEELDIAEPKLHIEEKGRIVCDTVHQRQGFLLRVAEKTDPRQGLRFVDVPPRT